ncbi:MULTISPECIES: 1-deoxy-D-xylulose-5-phosphate synthase [Bacillus amyloliquefaciens group]|uniref:1-deoxy-D-xylulose-5-phosphate synthase n=1 Tax=Bacillus amyloliquefaciens (strain ATCC 23350 / DSM 7 / BCRC 11601 / CCUG 28519 / NBRC 15535 / NRRL B-14393 / F) TaxID=692420 RepID=A0A9P1JI63_BACAS|nr:1-deoxy-D-xylulose-5-phosphate synthase [Bacillus amyloliquefaciens]AIW34377.1 1-deoxy-D-xylulose-5-phosphate synthase [Bacillus subtilis]AEB24659.1 1-deoxy-D-xylulose-5-phosphate synthase [Bacillus amyloliquefaciens TA208]AEK89673.1 1-deoxy-D-xylulose-5-phosphate synthase [Bacillus amyloliquefaciens XH7]ARW39598.1 1-deoxy-D-xylulose-5-phosphate synthase [Bacillus amyloliquefaciens]AZV89804.1 1-deoxy-D-xylulose-5-phosphate synthase [Bacillus amyloliquefaciens]
MDLLSIQDPSFLKKMSIEQLEELSEEIRNFLITSLSASGGHIGPNLGVVELTIALHKEFDSPKDKFLWDVGHQSYVHKLLTGRGKEFETLRQYKGLCGFPKRSESEHDVWETGHSSTSLSGAMGMAAARDIKGTKEYIIPIIGDGALTGGMALEALNHIGDEKKDMIVILNDNEMSIAPNVGAIHSMLGRLRTAGKYQWVKDELEYLFKRIPAVGGKLAATAERIKDSLKYMLVSGMFFEELGFTYLGPVDGHSYHELIENLQYAKKTKGPVLLHVITKKGKGYKPAETDTIGTWHGTGPYKINTGDFVKPKAAAPSWSGLVSGTVQELAREDDRIVAITPAMPVGSKLEGFAKEFPERMFDVGIAEQHAATMAAGMALQGMKPFLAIYSTFLQRAYDQVVHDICRQNANVFIGIDRAGLVGADGETHQGVFDIAFLRHIPNLVLMMPKDENEGRHMVNTALSYEEGPIAMRFPRGNGLGVKMDKELKSIPIGTWEVLRPGKDAVILTFGTTIEMALEAAEELQKEGLSVRVVNARFIKPIDKQMMKAILNEGLPILTIEEAVLEGGFGSTILEFAHDLGMYHTPIDRMGIPDRFIEHGSVTALLEEIGLTKAEVMNRIKLLMPPKTHKGIGS